MATISDSMATTTARSSARPSWLAKLSVGKVAAQLALLLFVVVWTVPTAGLLISSVREPDQLRVSGWWESLVRSEANSALALAPAADQIEEGGNDVIRSSVLPEGDGRTDVRFGTSINNPSEFAAGETAEMRIGGQITVNADGTYEWVSATPFEHDSARIFLVLGTPPTFTLRNYDTVFNSEGIGRSFVNSFTVTIPATIIPILIAAFAAYALAWMQFPFRGVLVALIVGLLVVPLQMSLIPLLRMYNGIAGFTGGSSKTYLGVWLAHTGFGLPLAIYLLRNYMAGLPKEIMESARMDGASHFQIFTTMVLPLSFPALASFAIFQFLWVWNDLLVATVFLGNNESQLVLTARLRELLGSRGDSWEILTAGAFISIVVPLIVFFSLQRYFVRGLLAGSVKGG